MAKKWREAARSGKSEEEKGRGARCARVNWGNWARTNWDGNAEDRTRRKGKQGVSGGVWRESHQ